jgi:hypothetical protein
MPVCTKCSADNYEGVPDACRYENCQLENINCPMGGVIINQDDFEHRAEMNELYDDYELDLLEHELAMAEE